MDAINKIPRWVGFGPFQVELNGQEIRRQGFRIKLQEKPLRALTLLLERAGQLVTREELRQRLWGVDTFVDFDANLYTTLNKLRRALGDSLSPPRYIETIPGRGYRFIAPVTPLGFIPAGAPGRVSAQINSASAG